jgi:hypothetical protein
MKINNNTGSSEVHYAGRAVGGIAPVLTSLGLEMERREQRVVLPGEFGYIYADEAETLPQEYPLGGIRGSGPDGLPRVVVGRSSTVEDQGYEIIIGKTPSKFQASPSAEAQQAGIISEPYMVAIRTVNSSTGDVGNAQFAGLRTAELMSPAYDVHGQLTFKQGQLIIPGKLITMSGYPQHNE